LIGCVDYHLTSHRAVEQKIDEILIIVEANAIRDPGAMMIHFENASIALTAMVSSIGLGPQTPLTHSNTTHLFLFNREILREFHSFLTAICCVTFLI
jgi:hypothetical protein